MAQRGGSVTTQVRFGDKVHSPIIGLGEADILVSFEKMEAVRWIDHLKKGGTAIINEFEIPSAPILTGEIPYPEGTIEYVKENFNTITVDAETEANKVGNIKTMNVIMMGALARELKLDNIDWKKIIEQQVKERFIEVNKKAFDVGYNL